MFFMILWFYDFMLWLPVIGSSLLLSGIVFSLGFSVNRSFLYLSVIGSSLRLSLIVFSLGFSGIGSFF